jgi:DegV family protein with EDD domain
MKWNIVSDSSCDLTDIPERLQEVTYSSVPFTISVGRTDYVDDENLDVAELIKAMENCPEASHTSCPSPGAWYEQFSRAEQSIAVTISSQLSGSYNSAQAAKDIISEEQPEKKVYVLDSHAAGAELVLIVKKIHHLVSCQVNFEDVVTLAQEYADKTHVLFALSSFENLVKKGRMSRISGFIAGKLGMWAIGLGSDEGKIEMRHKTRGTGKMLSLLIEEMQHRGFSGDPVVISHCQNAEAAETLREKINAIWKTAEVSTMPTRGLCSYYAEKGGLIIAF